MTALRGGYFIPEKRQVADGFASDFKRFFVRGLAAVLPTLLTLAIISWLVALIYTSAGVYINQGFRMLVALIWRQYGTPPPFIANQQQWDVYFWWVGFFLTLAMIYFLGRFLASWIGRSIWRMIERAFFRVPVIRQIYPYAKQVTDFLFAEKRLSFSRVVAAEYPRKGIWSLGLVTGQGLRTVSQKVGGDMLTVFIPTTPTPVAGYTILVRHDEVIDLPLSIDDAFRFIVSGGVIIPASESLVASSGKEPKGALPPTRKEITA